jgi:ABC-type Fe3+/spermidine/putrescine transport system ATPase subunit
MATLLEANEVTKIYAKGQRPSLNKVSFNVAESEFIAIMGASGSGKTTLLNVLSTIDTPTSGSIVINGVNLKQLSDTGSADFRRDNLGFIFQEYFLLDSLTIREMVKKREDTAKVLCFSYFGNMFALGFSKDEAENIRSEDAGETKDQASGSKFIKFYGKSR